MIEKLIENWKPGTKVSAVRTVFFLGVLFSSLNCSNNKNFGEITCIKTKPPVDKATGLEVNYLGLANNAEEVGKFKKGGGKKIPSNFIPDFNKSLNAMWEYKVNYSRGNDAVKQASNLKMNEYNKSPFCTTLNNYINLASNVAETAFKELDWNKVAKSYRLNNSKIKVLKKALRQIKGDELVAYGMTELFPSTNGPRNKRILEYLLMSAGANYVNSIPAHSDKISSFGLYQFTSNALYDSADEIRGASKMNRNIKDNGSHIPSSVNLLATSADHHGAAYFFAANNLAELVHSLNERQLNALDNYLDNPGNGIIQYIATAHTLPARARESANRWLDNKTKSNFRNSCGKNRTKQYAYKTIKNYAILKQGQR